MDITVYGKVGCEPCEAAMIELHQMKLKHRYVDLMTPVEDWRENGVVEAMSWYMLWETLPVIRIDQEYMTYPEAMRFLKKQEARVNG